MPCAALLPLSQQPSFEQRGAVRRETLEKLVVQGGCQAVEGWNVAVREDPFDGLADREYVDLDRGRLDRHEVLVGPDALAPGLVQHAPQLG